MNIKSNIKTIVTASFLLVSGITFSQANSDIDKDMKEGLSEISELLESLDFNKLINEDLIAELQKIKPSEKQIGEMQTMMQESIKAMEKIDFSAFEDIFKEMEKAMGDIAPMTEPSAPTKKKTPPPVKGKRI